MADNQTKVISGEKARQGKKGTRILWLLLTSLVLVLLAWFIAGSWGMLTAPDVENQPPAGVSVEPPAEN